MRRNSDPYIRPGSGPGGGGRISAAVATGHPDGPSYGRPVRTGYRVWEMGWGSDWWLCAHMSGIGAADLAQSGRFTIKSAGWSSCAMSPDMAHRLQKKKSVWRIFKILYGSAVLANYLNRGHHLVVMHGHTPTVKFMPGSVVLWLILHPGCKVRGLRHRRTRRYGGQDSWI